MPDRRWNTELQEWVYPGDWRPIDTYPTKEPECLKARLVYLPTQWRDFMVPAFFENGKWYQAYTGLDRPRTELLPTHWMPLPSSPEADK